MANKHTKRCSVSLVIGEMQTNAPMRCQNIPTIPTIPTKPKESTTVCWNMAQESCKSSGSFLKLNINYMTQHCHLCVFAHKKWKQAHKALAQNVHCSFTHTAKTRGQGLNKLQGILRCNFTQQLKETTDHDSDRDESQILLNGKKKKKH